jgi:hypothetical protein
MKLEQCCPTKQCSGRLPAAADFRVMFEGKDHMNKVCRWYFALPCIFLLLTSIVVANETKTRSYSLPDHGSLYLQVPTTWADQVREPPGQLPPTITFSQEKGDPFKVLMTPLWAVNNRIVLPNGDDLRRLVQQSAQRFAAQAVEKSIDVKEVKGTSGIGFYFSAADRAPKPGEFTYLTHGVIRIGELMTTFTILTNEGQEHVVSDSLVMLRTAMHSGPTGATPPVNKAQSTKSTYRIPFPIGKSLVEFPLGGLRVTKEDKTLPWYFLSDSKSGLNVSFNFDHRKVCDSSESCRDYLANVKVPKTERLDTWRTSQPGEAYLFEHMLGPVQGGFDLRQYHMHANYFRDGVWLDVHLSKVRYEEKDRDIFLEFVKSIEIK